MSTAGFTSSFTVNQSPAAAVKAITNPRGWWSEEIEGDTDKLGDEFTYRHKDVHKCQLKLTELIPDRKVVYHILDNYFNFTEDETEWTGTDLIFDVADQGGKTEVRFTHAGLVPDYECYDVCSSAWSGYMNGSLRSLITTGQGQPNEKE